ncbi:Trichothecene 8-O-acetyltransferase [Paramyrothecium foliicola]|nr:Trichothecene 8-O-acetyltransferase [Paramyrothecium foliicola]
MLEIEALTPFDLIMTDIYFAVLLTFQPSSQIETAIQNHKRGLEGLCKTIPWITGRIVQADPTEKQQLSLQMQWSVNDEVLQLCDKGTVALSYEQLAAEGMQPSSIPSHVWPQDDVNAKSDFTMGSPVFSASFFRFSNDTGLGLSILVHHKSVDIAGLAMLIRQWAASTANRPVERFITSHNHRQKFLSVVLGDHLETANSQSVETLMQLHRCNTVVPPSRPAKLPARASKVFRLSVAQINTLRPSLIKLGVAVPTTNTILTALVWQAITRARTQRDPALLTRNSRLTTSVKCRKRLSSGSYFGKFVVFARAELSMTEMSASEVNYQRQLAWICSNIDKMQSSEEIDRRRFAEVYSLCQRIGGNNLISAGEVSLEPNDILITSYANTDFYDLDFGPRLGKIDFFRPYDFAMDSVLYILPRERTYKGRDAADEVIEIFAMLRQDDMEVLERDPIWTRFFSNT